MVRLFVVVGVLLALLGFGAALGMPAQEVCVLGVAVLHVFGYALLAYFLLIRPWPAAKNPLAPAAELGGFNRLGRGIRRLWLRLGSCRCWGYLLLLVAAVLELSIVLWLHHGRLA
jgi:hypothetical protein